MSFFNYKMLFLSVFGGFSSAAVFAQQHTFQMSAFGIDFGKLTVTRTQENDSTELYSLYAKGLLKIILWERNDETQNTVRYQNGKLVSSDFMQKETKKITQWNKIRFDGKKYIVDSEKGKRTFTKRPAFSVLKLYFENPESLTEIFSEAEADYIPMRHINDNTVEVKNKNGGKGLYYYKDNVIQELEFYTAIAKVNAKKLH